MATLRALEYILIVLAILFVFYEVILPGLTGLPLFPHMRKRTRNIQKDIEEFNQKVNEEKLETTLARRRKQREAKLNKEKEDGTNT